MQHPWLSKAHRFHYNEYAKKIGHVTTWIFPILINGRVVAGGLCPPPWRPGPELQKASFVPSAKNKSWSGILGKFQYLLIFLATFPMANAFLREKTQQVHRFFWEYVMDLQARHLTCAPFLRVPQVTSIDCIYLWFIRNIIVYLRKPNTEQKCQASHPPPRYMLRVRNSQMNPFLRNPIMQVDFFVENWQVHPYFSLNWCYLAISTSPLNNIQNQAGATGKCQSNTWSCCQ